MPNYWPSPVTIAASTICSSIAGSNTRTPSRRNCSRLSAIGSKRVNCQAVELSAKPLMCGIIHYRSHFHLWRRRQVNPRTAARESFLILQNPGRRNFKCPQEGDVKPFVFVAETFSHNFWHEDVQRSQGLPDPERINPQCALHLRIPLNRDGIPCPRQISRCNPNFGHLLMEESGKQKELSMPK